MYLRDSILESAWWQWMSSCAVEKFSPFKGLNSYSWTLKMEGGLTFEFTFMSGVSGLIFITMVWPDDLTSIVRMNYLYSKEALEGIPVLADLQIRGHCVWRTGELIKLPSKIILAIHCLSVEIPMIALTATLLPRPNSILILLV